MAKKVFKWGQWTELAQEFGFKMKAPVEFNPAKKKVQREKFACCKSCGGQMTYHKGTNVLTCENVVEKTKKVTTETGEEVEKTFKEVCGNTNIVDRDYIGYMEYLFN